MFSQEKLIIFAIIFFLSLPFQIIKFKKLFFLYLFLFIPLFLVFRDLYIRINGDFPHYVTIIKEVVWLQLFIIFILWILVNKKKLYYSNTILNICITFTILLFINTIRWYFASGAFGVLYNLRSTFMYIPAVLIAISLMTDKNDFAKIVRYFSYAILAAGAFGLYQIIFRIPPNLAIIKKVAQYNFANTSFFADYNAFGWFCATGLPLIICYRNATGDKNKLYLITILVSIFNIVTSNSRAALSATIVVMFLLFFKRLLKIKILVLIILLLFASFKLLNSYDIFDIKTHRMQANIFLDSRITMVWPILWNTYLQRPFFGYGWGAFGGTSYFMGLDLYGVGESQLGESIYLVLLLNTGIPGLALFLIFMFSIFISSLKLIRSIKDKFISNMFIGLNTALLVAFIQGGISNVIDGFPYNVYFWFLVGMRVAVILYAQKIKNTEAIPLTTCG